ncbi:uncharacterized protein LOC110983442 [Acanthaster planci]|uniref:Uncharacterized protein LOC110983442 n=1 Tax=Acanthaster planci TaxID=133434 RepID=A0A8B7Z0T5_ACAPL|nr:uncharacterized protein LOC110983442 [Acanthaster planci]
MAFSALILSIWAISVTFCAAVGQLQCQNILIHIGDTPISVRCASNDPRNILSLYKNGIKVQSSENVSLEWVRNVSGTHLTMIDKSSYSEVQTVPFECRGISKLNPAALKRRFCHLTVCKHDEELTCHLNATLTDRLYNAYCKYRAGCRTVPVCYVNDQKLPGLGPKLINSKYHMQFQVTLGPNDVMECQLQNPSMLEIFWQRVQVRPPQLNISSNKDETTVQRNSNESLEIPGEAKPGSQDETTEFNRGPESPEGDRSGSQMPLMEQQPKSWPFLLVLLPLFLLLVFISPLICTCSSKELPVTPGFHFC